MVVVLSDLWLYVLDTQVKRGVELSTDHHLFVSWIRWWGRLLDRPCKAKQVVRVNWNIRKPLSIRSSIHTSRIIFFHLSKEVGDMESEWTMFRTSIADTTSKSCGLNVVCACHGSNRRIQWWTPAVREANKLKKEAFQAWLSRGSPEVRHSH